METTCILSDDVVEEILVRIPVKYLLQWKCVCKHWYALIGDSGFNKKHYHFQYEMHLAEHDDIPLFLCTASMGSNPDQFYLLSKHQGDNVVLNLTTDFERDIPIAFANYSEVRNYTPHSFGVVNGIVGLEWSRTRLALWNPATREFKDVPSWPIENKAGARIVGFGFDLQSNDFKILGVIDYKDYDNDITIDECHMYSLKANSWKRLKEIPSSSLVLDTSVSDAYLDNGVYYWYAFGQNNSGQRAIISFNFSTELFKEIEPPVGSGCHKNLHERTDDGRELCCCKGLQKIGRYKKGLAFYGTRYLENTISVEIWAASEILDDGHGVPLSWQLLLTVGPIQSISNLFTKTLRASGDLLLIIERGDPQEVETSTEACIYDPCTRTFSNLEVPFWCCFSYVESLFLNDLETAIMAEAQDKKESCF